MAATAYALRILVAVAGGVPHLPDLERTEKMLARLGEASLGGKPVRATWSRTLVDARHQGTFLCRERRNLPAPMTRCVCTWDGRYRFQQMFESADLYIAPLGADMAKMLTGETSVSKILARTALAAEPALWTGGRCVDVLSSDQTTPVVAPWARFLSGFDLVPANAVIKLLGAGPIPASPCRGRFNIYA